MRGRNYVSASLELPKKIDDMVDFLRVRGYGKNRSEVVRRVLNELFEAIDNNEI